MQGKARASTLSAIVVVGSGRTSFFGRPTHPCAFPSRPITLIPWYGGSLTLDNGLTGRAEAGNIILCCGCLVYVQRVYEQSAGGLHNHQTRFWTLRSRRVPLFTRPKEKKKVILEFFPEPPSRIHPKIWRCSGARPRSLAWSRVRLSALFALGILSGLTERRRPDR